MAEQTDIKTETVNDEESQSESTADKPGHGMGFQVDMNLIPAAQLKDEIDDLRGLGLDVFNQEELEQGIVCIFLLGLLKYLLGISSVQKSYQTA